MEYRELFREHGIKWTSSRLCVYQVLEEATAPLGAQAICDAVHRRSHAVDLSTVYRILSIFVERKMVSRTLVDEEDKALYELRRDVHKHHFVCLRCRKIFPLAGCPLEQYEPNLGQGEGFLVEGHKLEVYGYCPRCREQMEKEEAH